MLSSADAQDTLFSTRRLVLGLVALLLGAVVLSCANSTRMAAEKRVQGDACLQEGAYGGAVAAYREAIGLISEDVDAHIGLGRAYAGRGEYDAAVAEFRNAIRLAPGRSDAHRFLGEIHFDHAEYGNAIRELEEATRLDPGDAQSHLALALSLLGMNCFLEGTGSIPALELPRLFHRRLNGKVFEKRELPERAISEFQEAIQLIRNPKTAKSLQSALGILRWHRGTAWYRQGRIREAAEECRIALSLNSSCVDGPDTLDTRFEYDLTGNVVARMDANGDETRYEYDGLERMIQISYPDGSQASFKYDRVGNRTQMTDPTGTTRYAYDAFDRLIQVIFPNGSNVKYEYNEAGKLSAIVYPDGRRVAYAYGGTGHLTSVTVDSVATEYAYDVVGNLSEVTFPNGVRSAYSYDAVGRVTSVTHTRDGKVLLASRTVIDALGRSKEKTVETMGGKRIVVYARDALGRILSERWSDGFSVAYEYDTAGNRTKRIARGDTTTYVYGRDHRLLLAGSTRSVYDRRGYLAERFSEKGKMFFRYDFEGRLIEVQSEPDTVRFLYRGDGRRWAKIVDEDTTLYIHADAGFPGILMETDLNGRPRARFTLGNGRVSRHTLDGGTLFYLDSGLNGTCAAMTDLDGGIVVRLAYDAFGNIVEGDQEISNLCGFAGGNYEPNIGLLYVNGQYYDPAVGQFLTPKDCNPLSTIPPDLNLYTNSAFLPKPQTPNQISDDGEAAIYFSADDPVSVVVDQVLQGRYIPPVKCVPGFPSTSVAESALEDQRSSPFAREIARMPWAVLSKPEPKAVPKSLMCLGAATLSARIGAAYLQEIMGGPFVADILEGITTSSGGMRDVPPLQRVGTGARFTKEAAKLFEPIEQVESDSSYATYRALLDKAKGGDAQSSDYEAFLEQASEGAWTPQVQILLGKRFLQEGRTLEARRVYEELANEWMGDTWGDDILIGLALVNRQKGDPEAVQAVYDQLITDFPESGWTEDALHILAQTYQRAGRIEEALSVYAQFVGGLPQNDWTDDTFSGQPTAGCFSTYNDINSVAFDETNGQLIFTGWYDRSLPPLNMDDFVVAIRSIYRKAEDPALSIGTENCSVQDYRKVSYYGGIEGTAFGQAMFEADRLLKSLCFGVDNVSGGALIVDVPGYQNIPDWTLSLGSLVMGMVWDSRVWFVPMKIEVIVGEGGMEMRFGELTMQVLTESQFNGRYSYQPGVEAFARHLTEHYEPLEDRYPEIRRLRQMAKIVAVVKWMRDNRVPVDFSWVDAYRISQVDTPEMTPAIESSVTKKEWEAEAFRFNGIRFTLEGGVSFRERNLYKVDETTAQQKAAVLKTRPRGAQSWIVETEGRALNAGSLSLSRSRMRGNLKMAFSDVSIGTGRSQLNLTRYYDSFDSEDRGFGPGWSVLPYEVRISTESRGVDFVREASDFEGALFVDRIRGRQKYIMSGTSSQQGERLKKEDDGGYLLTLKDGTQLHFDPFWKLQSVSDRHGNVRNYHYQGDRLTAISDPSGQRVRVLYDETGHAIRAEGPAAQLVRYEYDVDGSLGKVIGSSGKAISYSYNRAHHLTRVSDEEKVLSQVVFDAYGRVTLRRDADGHLVAYDSSPLIRQTTVLEEHGQQIVRKFDEEYRLVSEMDLQDRGISVSYNDSGHPARIKDARGYTAELHYDHRDDLIGIVDPTGATIRFDYDRGRPILLVNPNGKGILLSYDHRGNMVEVMKDVSYQRNTMGRLKSYEPNEHKTLFTYDTRGNLLSVTGAKNQTTRFDYDDYGNLTRITDAGGNATEATFDGRSRTTKIVDSAGRWMAFEYDDRDRITQISTSIGAFRYDYNADDKLSRIIAPDGTDTAFTYREGRLIAVRTTDGAQILCREDPSERQMIFEESGGMRRLYEYDEFGRILRIASLPSAGL
ncbi:MAG: tetratricopeptide repeat protein [Candidatus Latescibacterota bacterium]